jgi:hypothetical protein
MDGISQPTQPTQSNGILSHVQKTASDIVSKALTGVAGVISGAKKEASNLVKPDQSPSEGNMTSAMPHLAPATSQLGAGKRKGKKMSETKKHKGKKSKKNKKSKHSSKMRKTKRKSSKKRSNKHHREKKTSRKH